MSSTVTNILPFAIIDVVLVSLTGFVCTLAIVVWLVLICIHFISERQEKREDAEPKQKKDATTETHELHQFTGTQMNGEDEPDGAFANTMKKADKQLSIHKNMHVFVRYFFPVLKKGSNNIDASGEAIVDETTILLNREVPNIFLKQLLLFTLVVLALSLHVFISNYLFVKSYGCSTEPYVHCYEAKVHFLIVDNKELDCTDSTATENITSIICYDLTLNATWAVSDAAATIAGAAFYFALITWILLKLSNIKYWKNTKNKLCKFKLKKFICIASVQVIITVIAGAVVSARIVALYLDGDTVYEDFIYVIINIYVVILGGAIPWWKFKLCTHS